MSVKDGPDLAVFPDKNSAPHPKKCENRMAAGSSVAKTAMSIRIGLAGWSYEDWKGRVYPETPPPGFDALSFIAEHFGCVELNNTFYRPPPARMSEGWVRKTAAYPAFLFTAKLWEKFTHDKDGFTDQDVKTFREGIQPLAAAGKLAALLMQFPWFFQDGPEARARIEGIADHFRDAAPLLVEVRHTSFGTPDFISFLEKLKVGFCNIDQPRSSTSLTGTGHITGPVGYIRLHGRNREAWFRKGAGRDEKYDYLYSSKELEPWARAAREMEPNCRTLFVIFNNHFQGKAAVNALMLKRTLEETTIRIPETLRAAYPEIL